MKAVTSLLSRSVARAQPGRCLPALTTHSSMLAIDPQRRLFSASSALCDDVIVKVPQMAESISEGTLASLLKKVGEQVEADEELASIETDKIDVAVNCPEGGVVREFFVSEGDTVTVGQDIARIETGAQAEGGASEKQQPAQEEYKEEPAQKKPEESAPKEETKVEEKPVQKKEDQAAPKPKPVQTAPPAAAASEPLQQGAFSRAERTVSNSLLIFFVFYLLRILN